MTYAFVARSRMWLSHDFAHSDTDFAPPTERDCSKCEDFISADVAGVHEYNDEKEEY